MNNSDNSDEENIPKSPFAVYRTEADALFRSAKYTKAIKSYSQALELQPDHEHCLVARSRCYLFEGLIDKALADAESSLANNSKNPKGLFQKAEVYYFQSEFEKALVLYHRGHKLRPEMEAFRLGIQKSEEAINNSVGNPETIKLRLDCDLSYFFLNDEKKNERVIKKKTQEKKKTLERKPCNTDSRTVKQLLGELYSDREFLEKLLNEEETLVNKTENSEQIRHLVVKGLNYLDERSDFWQQQKPMYARKKFHLKSKSSTSFVTKQQRDIIKYVVSTLDEIDNKQIKGEHKKAIKQSEYLIKQIDKWSENDLPDRLDIVANLFCLIGNSYLDMEEYENALHYHEKDKEFGKKHKIEESLSRSIDNIGRVYAKQKQYGKAIEIWQEKIPISKSALESTWLHHEMGRCYLELADYEKAIDFGEKSIEFAREAEDDTWQMNASILVAHASTKYKKYNLAIEYFQRALEYSKIMKNINVEEAVKKAIEDVNQKMIAEECELSSKENEAENSRISPEISKSETRNETENTEKSKDTSKTESRIETENTDKSKVVSKTETRSETDNTGKSKDTSISESKNTTENTERSVETTKTESKDEIENQNSNKSTERNISKNETTKDEFSASEDITIKEETTEKETREKKEVVSKQEHISEQESVEKTEIVVEKDSFEKKEKDDETAVEKERIVVEKESKEERNVIIEKEIESERIDDETQPPEISEKLNNNPTTDDVKSPKDNNSNGLQSKSDNKAVVDDFEETETSRTETNNGDYLVKNEHKPNTPLEEIKLE